MRAKVTHGLGDVPEQPQLGTKPLPVVTVTGV